VLIDNPLRSFVLPVAIVDQVQQDNASDPNSPSYSKPQGYETVRYPLSGLCRHRRGPAGDQGAQHRLSQLRRQREDARRQHHGLADAAGLSSGRQAYERGLVVDKFRAVPRRADLHAVLEHHLAETRGTAPIPAKPVTALENPHNYIHLAVGGFDIPTYNASPIGGANGDMGENDTAALDPIFYFHHCFIDYTFWTLAAAAGHDEAFTIDMQDPGASYANNQPPAGANQGDMLTMATRWIPFARDDGSYYTSEDCVDIEGQLGYSYGPARSTRWRAAGDRGGARSTRADRAGAGQRHRPLEDRRLVRHRRLCQGR
jgi:tyrosinase